MTPQFAAIVINWNGAEDTLACLESLHSADPAPANVVVVDNASTDDGVDRIRAWAEAKEIPSRVAFVPAAPASEESPWLTILCSLNNKGFSGGNNVGIGYFLGKKSVTHFLLLNNDAVVDRKFFGEMQNALGASPRAGLLTGTIYEHPARDRVWYAGGREIPFRALIAHNLEVPDSADPRQTEFVSGCAMMISRELRQELGPLPECYFPLYSEDAEYSYRARAAGFPVLYIPRAIVFHKIGATVGAAKESAYITRTQIRHRVLYVRRNFRGLKRYVALAYITLTKPGKAIMEVLGGRPRMGLAVLRGTIEGFAAECQ